MSVVLNLQFAAFVEIKKIVELQELIVSDFYKSFLEMDFLLVAQEKHRS